MSRKSEIIKAILYSVAAVGSLVVVIALPNLSMVFKPFYAGKRFNQSNFKQAIKKLEAKELIYVGQKGKSTIIELTEKGKKKVLEFNLEN